VAPPPVTPKTLAPAKVPAPAKPARPAKAPAASANPYDQSAAPFQDESFNLNSENGPSAAQYDYPEIINLSPAGLPPTTGIPAKSGEARVEKSTSRPNPARPAALTTAKATSPTRPTARGGTRPYYQPGSIQRFWQAAQKNWARYGGTPHSRPPSLSPVRTAASSRVIGHTSTGIPIQELTQFSGF
jgi:hypothetical protein